MINYYVKNIIRTLFIGFIFILMNPAYIYGGETGLQSETGQEYLFFYVTPCEACDIAKEILDQLENEENVLFTRLNIYEEDNLLLYFVLAEINSIPERDRQVPVLFFDGGYTIDFSYEAVLEIISAFQGIDLSDIRYMDAEQALIYVTRNYLLFFWIGLLNGFNPCSISMILLLFSLLAVKKLNIIKLGLAYTLGRWITYLAIGLLLYGFISTIDGQVMQRISTIITWFLVLASLTLALLHFFDFLAAKREQYGKIRVQLPRFLRDFNHKLIQNTSLEGRENLIVLAVFALAVFVSVGEFICTGQIYLATIIYLNRSDAGTAVLPLLIYVTAMIIPSLVLTVLVARGKNAFELSEIFRRNMPVVKLAGMVFFLGFAVYLIAFSL